MNFHQFEVVSTLVNIMKFFQTFLQFFVSLFLISISFATTSDDDMTKLISSAIPQVDLIERQVISAQSEFMSLVQHAANKTKRTQNRVKLNKNLAPLMPPMNNIAIILWQILSQKKIQRSNFQNLTSANCKKINVMITALEPRMDLLLEIEKDDERQMSNLESQTHELKLAYFSNYIFLNKTLANNVLSTIATLEKLSDQSQTFFSILYSSAKDIANILYDLKVAQANSCIISKKGNPMVQTSTKPTVKMTKKTTRTTTEDYYEE